MKKSKKAEGFVGIIIGVFILSFALIGIISILNFNKDNDGVYNDFLYKYILEGNTQNIATKIDTNNIGKNETFYLYKNTLTKEFELFTGAINENYKYINKLGEKINPDINIGKTYKRELIKKADILKHNIEPSDINNMIFRYDATNIDGSNNSTLTDGDLIGTWKDLSGNTFDAIQTSGPKKPQLQINTSNNLSFIKFDSSKNNMFEISSNTLINDDGDTVYNKYYPERSFSLVIKTGFDITSDQTIFEEGGNTIGYTFMIHNGDLYAMIYNNETSTPYDWDTGNKFKSIKLSKILPGNIYIISLVQDSTHINETGTPSIDDSNDTIKLYLNGKYISELDHVDPQAEHGNIGLGGISFGSIEAWNTYNQLSCNNCNNFNGYIGEFIGWNHALDQTEITGIQNYLIEKWLNGKSSIYHNTINYNINKIN